jgi:restriction system protein
MDQRWNPCPKCGDTRVTISATASVVATATASVSSFVAQATGTVTNPPALVLLSATVVSLGKVPDGDLIQVVGPAWDAIAKLLEEDPMARFQIPDRKWEELIAASYDKAGYKTTLTHRSGDGGRDVIAEKSGDWSVRIVDQVKAYGHGRRVTADDVRALLGVLGADHKASKGLVTTTAEFAPGIATDQAIQQYVPTRLELVDGTRLIERFAKLRRK